MSSDLLFETKRKIARLNRKDGSKLPYPQFVKDAIVELSKKMSASQIANELGLSKTFVCKIERKARSNQNGPISKEEKHQSLQFFNITDNFKSFMKEGHGDDSKSFDNSQMPVMRFTTNGGTFIETFP